MKSVAAWWDRFASIEVSGIRRVHGEVMVASLVTLYKKLKFVTDENVGWGPVDLPEIESLKQSYALEPDAAKRKAMAERIQALAFDNVNYVPLGINFTPIAYRDTVKGILPSPVFFYWNIEVTR